ncbi:MAG: hypothetical protein ACRDL6_11285 [Solirubrobacterales bacterium]
MPPATQNLNAKLSARPDAGRAERGSGVRAQAPVIHSSAPPVRIVSAGSYRGGYRVER